MARQANNAGRSRLHHFDNGTRAHANFGQPDYLAWATHNLGNLGSLAGL
jgi:hypothetical protein